MKLKTRRGIYGAKPKFGLRLFWVRHDILLDCSFHLPHQMAEKAWSKQREWRDCRRNQISEGFIPNTAQ